MSKHDKHKLTSVAPPQKPSLSEQIGTKAKHKLRARRRSHQGIWFGIGMMGLIGWSVAVPTVLGAALGVWIDNHYVSQRSWTLALLIAGLIIGCVTAWSWVHKEYQAMRETNEDEENDE